ncbi:MAG: hypothetical protein AAGH78_00105 [Cyanobacteria bacterium P01_H01_bin.58]
MKNLIEQLPNILNQSDNLFGLFGLLAVVIAVIAFLFFRNADIKRKERIFIYTVVSFFVFAAITLSAGLFSGVEIGKDVTVNQIEEDPSIIEITPKTITYLEELLSAESQPVTSENKASLIETSVEKYIDSLRESEPISANQRSDGESTASQVRDFKTERAEVTQVKDVEGFLFGLQKCSRNNELNLSCSLKITNKEGRKSLTAYNSYYQEESKIADFEGEQYFVEKVIFGSDSNRNRVTQELTENVSIRAEIEFKDIPQEIEKLALVELLFAHPGPNTFIVQFFDVPVDI